MTLRAHFRTAVDLTRTDNRCQAKALGTAGSRLLGWYHYTKFCALPKGHYGDSHRSRDGGVWPRDWRETVPLRQSQSEQYDEGES